MKRTSFLGVGSRISCRSSQNCSASSALLVGAQTWITVLLNGLPQKQTEIILSFLRLHSSTAFQTLLLTMRATQFLLRNSCAQQQIKWSSELNSSILVHLSSFSSICQCSLLPLLLDHIQFTLSWTQHSRFLCNIVVYSIRLYFHHQTHPQLSNVSAFAQPLHSFWSYQ